MDLNLSGRTALVTGASRGIGYAVARLLAAEGCNVHLASRSAADLDAARRTILAESKVNVTNHAVDLGVTENASKLAKELADVDILVNNAGAIPQGTITGMSDKQVRDGWELKLFGYINVTREIYARMCEKRRGVIVNIIGNAGHRPSAGYIAGAIANAGLMAMTKALGAESPDHGVRVVGVNPVGTETERAAVRLRERATKELKDPERWRELVKNNPFGRMTTSEEIANMVVFLASDRASYMSGQVVIVDGGSSYRK
jgi:NAD(P)-dependent dehydrogenase (short-subunit alcohol dehydrogenase family)